MAVLVLWTTNPVDLLEQKKEAIVYGKVGSISVVSLVKGKLTQDPVQVKLMIVPINFLSTFLFQNVPRATQVSTCSIMKILDWYWYHQWFIAPVHWCWNKRVLVSLRDWSKGLRNLSFFKRWCSTNTKVIYSFQVQYPLFFSISFP